VDDYDCVRKGWILENYPQTREQALALLSIGALPKHCGKKIKYNKKLEILITFSFYSISRCSRHCFD
jgi:hypothetical protein